MLCQKFPKLRTVLGVLYLALLVVMATRTWHRNEVWGTRETLFRSGVKELPQNAKAHYNMANLLKDRGDLERAEHHYRLAIRLYPRHPSYHLNLGTILTNLTEARHCYLEALRLFPNHKGALVNLGSLMIDEGNETGINFIQRALELDSNYFEGLLIMGKAKLAVDDNKSAGHYIKKALSLRPNNLNVRLYHGVYLQQTEQFEPALQEYQYVLSKRKDDIIAMKNAAKIQVLLEKLPEAMTLLKAITQIENNCVESLSLLAHVYKKMGHRHDAVISLAKASNLAPNNTNIQLKYVRALKDNNQTSLARTYLHQLTEKVPNDLHLLWFAFNFSMEDKRIEDAAQFVTDAISIAEKRKDESLKHLYLGQAEIYQNNKDYDRALQFYLKAIDHDYNFVDALVNAGSIYFIKKNHGQAEEYYLRALKINPNNYVANENLKILRGSKNAQNITAAQSAMN
ncbi:unnamed protein product [Lymnaea stagnalis]|uniref:Uncharacterized protein n=1 Tax=Lymnaea stagnalis TaxID=6523 RepID=A0AAV2HH60_LYMST